MHLSRALGLGLMVAMVTVTFSSCSGAAEQTLLTQFFAASRLRDLTALSKLSTVVFEPASDGIVTSFEITAIQATQGPDGHPMAKDVSIVAPVRSPSGDTALKAFVITMSRGVPGSDQYRLGTWLITAINAGPASPSTPPS
jgi:hypothetical protein